jgi:hypothetical protein
MKSPITKEMRLCISNCLECHATCTETAIHCLMLGGAHASSEHQRILADCAQSCITSADFMLRASWYHAEYCGVCAELCKACGDSCQSLASGDEVMQRCVEMCRRCEQSCREMAVVTARV